MSRGLAASLADNGQVLQGLESSSESQLDEDNEDADDDSSSRSVAWMQRNLQEQIEVRLNGSTDRNFSIQCLEGSD